MPLKDIDPKALIPDDYPPDSKFGERLKDNQEAKQRVAAAAVKKFVHPGGSILLADGTATFYIGLAIIHATEPLTSTDKKLHLRTNNLAVVKEFIYQRPKVFDRITIETPRGEIDPILFSINGEEVGEFIEKQLSRCTVAFLSASCIFGDRGCLGTDDVTRTFKLKILSSTSCPKIVLVADHTKFSHLPDEGSLIFNDQDDWISAVKKAGFYIYTTAYPGAPPSGQKPWNTKKNRDHQLRDMSPAERYTANISYLRDILEMGDRLVVVP